MKVILLRHGPAGRPDASRWSDDRLRPLTERGAVRTRQSVRGLVRLEPGISAVLTSPLARAVATARLLADELRGVKPEILEHLAPGGSHRRVIEKLAGQDSGGTVVLFGHEPDLGKLAGTLLFGAPAPVPLKKAGGCMIVFVGEPHAGKGQLVWFLPPRTLRRMARWKDTR